MKEMEASGYFFRLGAFFVLVGTLALLGHSLQAREAFALYFDVKYGTERQDGEWVRTVTTYPDVMNTCNRAFALYPHNYNLAQFASGVAYASRTVEEERHYWEMLTDAHTWTDRGLRSNPHFRPLIYQKVDIYEKYGDRDQAIDLLAGYTDWEYWNPENHARLAVLYAREGRLNEAGVALKLAGHDQAVSRKAAREVAAAGKRLREEEARWNF